MSGNLRRALTRYKDGYKNFYRDGDWTVAKGGYDLYFEISYQRIPKIRCIAGEIEVANGDGINVERCLKVVKEVYSEYRIHRD